MTIRSIENQQLHDDMIRALVNNLIGKGYQEIRASLLPEFCDLRPEKIYSEEAEMYFSPDVTALHNGYFMIFEVETVDSILAPSTQVELRTFAAHAAQHQASFYLVMPQQDQALAQATLSDIETRDQKRSFTLAI